MFRFFVVISFLLCGALFAQNAAPASTDNKAPQSASQPSAQTNRVAALSTSVYLSSRTSRNATMYYETVWGIDSLKVKYTESGEMIRFSYRVLDPNRAAPLNDKKAEPFLYDPEAGVKLVVPQMEKIGKLRQSSTAKSGMSYWMAFSNVGRRVRPGHRVSVEIGNFRAINLLVE
jgi:hypothetical protein